MTDLADDVVELAPYVPAPGEGSPLREIAFRANAWLPHEDGLLRKLFAEDAAIADIAQCVGRTFHATRARIDILGLRRNSTRPWLAEEDGELVERYGAEPCASIARDLGRSVSAVYARASMLSLSEGIAPEYDGWEDAQIRAGYAAGIPVGQIAALIGRPLLGVRSRASILGVRHPSQPPGWTDDEATRALGLAGEGHRYLAIIEMLVEEGFPRRSKIGFGTKLRGLGYGRGWGRPWLVEEEDLIRHAYATGASLTPLIERLGRSRSAIRWKVADLGLQGTHEKKAGWRTDRNWTAEEEEILRAEYGKTPNQELAKKLDRKWTALRVRANHLGLKHGWIRAFSADEDRALAIAWRQGVSIMDVAIALRRDPSVIGKRCRRVHGFSFSDPDRPARGPKTPRAKRVKITLDDILAMEAA